jgi:hypothetical protein
LSIWDGCKNELTGIEVSIAWRYSCLVS